MSEWRILRNEGTGKVVLARVRLCVSFWCHFRGLQLVPGLSDDEGLLFVRSGESRTATAIHMLFMRFSIGVVWLDKDRRVVDKQFAKPWRLSYTPSAAAQYFLEANPTVLERVAVGDRLRFDEAAS